MKKLTQEEAPQIQIKPRGRGFTCPHHSPYHETWQICVNRKQRLEMEDPNPVTYCRGLEKRSKLKYECHR